MKRLTLRERDALRYGADGELTEEEASAFARFETLLPKGAVSWEHRAIRFGPFCGVIRAGDVTVELLPKVDGGFHSAEQARGLLVGMLRATGELRLAKVGTADLAQQTVHLLDVFINDFCDEFRTALHGGSISRYVEFTENLYVIRGRLQLTEHLSRNAFNQSRAYCRFDERTVDNPFNRALKAVLRMLLGLSLSGRTKATVAALLHRFDEVADQPISAAHIDGLILDRIHKHWEAVFQRARWLAAGIFPDVRLGGFKGSSLLFNMERLFERVLGRRLRHACRSTYQGQFKVELQGPQRQLADSGFSLRPDISVWDGDRIASIVDAKWKRLYPTEPNVGVSSGDAYQMTAYASRYGCEHLALVFPASMYCPVGRVASFEMRIPNHARLDIVAVDLHDLTFRTGIPQGLELAVGDRMHNGLHRGTKYWPHVRSRGPFPTTSLPSGDLGGHGDH